MKRFVVPLLLVLGVLPSAASAACFTVYDRGNRILYRDVVTPIDLSGPISTALRQKFPNAQLIISIETGPHCTPISPRSPINPYSGAAII